MRLIGNGFIELLDDEGTPFDKIRVNDIGNIDK